MGRSAWRKKRVPSAALRAGSSTPATETVACAKDDETRADPSRAKPARDDDSRGAHDAALKCRSTTGKVKCRSLHCAVEAAAAVGMTSQWVVASG